MFSCLWFPGARLSGDGLPLKVAMPGSPYETPGSCAGLLPAGGC